MVYLQMFFTHYPSRLLRVGIVLFSGFVLIACLLFWVFCSYSVRVSAEGVRVKEQREALPTFQEENPAGACLEVPDLTKEWSLSLVPPFPGKESEQSFVMLSLKNGSGVKMLSLPSIVGFSFDDSGSLRFSQEEDRFGAVLSRNDREEFQCALFVVSDGVKRERESILRIEQPPVHSKEQIPRESALRSLMEAHWLGPDLLMRSVSRREQQTIQSAEKTMMRVGVNEFLIVQEGKWTRSDTVEAPPAVRIRAVAAHGLDLDSWDESGTYRRLLMPLISAQHTLPKMDEVFSAWRIRSEKQVSCMVDKRSLLVRVGDWVLKDRGRWRVIRSQEEKKAVLSGQKSGELVILEGIDVKQKSVRGVMFSEHYLQSTPFCVSVPNLREQRNAQKGNIK